MPVSAALLLTGALALCLGAFLLPSTEDATRTVSVVQQHDAHWLAVAVILFLAAVFLTLGLPSILTLFETRGRVLALVSAVALEVGFIGTAGFAMLMVFFRSLAITGSIRNKGIDDVASEAGLAAFLVGWVLALYLGELLLAIALLRARSVSQWVPVVLLLHVGSFLVSAVLPEYVAKAAVLLLVAGFAGVAIQATTPQKRLRPRVT